MGTKVEPPSKANLDGVRSGSRSLVLLRLKCIVGAETIARGAVYRLSSITRDESPSLRWLLPLTTPALKDSEWSTWWLEPGTYSLTLADYGPPGEIVEDHHHPDIPLEKIPPDKKRGLPGRHFLHLWFEVPAGVPAVNLGSLQWRYRVLGKPAAVLKGLQKWSLEALVQSKDEDDATLTAEQVLGRGVVPVHQPARFGPPGNPSSFRGSTIAYTPAGAVDNLQQPNWVGWKIGSFVGTPSEIANGVPGALSLGGLGAVLYLAYLPFGATAGVISGSGQASAMKAGTEEFLREAFNLRPENHLSQELTSRMPAATAEAADPTAPTLRCESQIVRVALVELNARGSFGLEVTARLVWRRTDNEILAMERVFTARPDFPPPDPDIPVRPFMQRVYSGDTYDAKALKAAGAGARLARSLPSILTDIASQAAQEWQAAWAREESTRP